MARHKPRRKENAPRTVVAASGACGKVAYHDRKAARRALKTLPQQRMRPYACDGCGLWHVGHLTKAVRRGDFTAREIYGSVPA